MPLNGNGMSNHLRTGCLLLPVQLRHRRQPSTALPNPENRPTVYEVKHGDALVLIGKKFGLTVSQLQSFNGLKGDTIRIGQKLKIPTVAEVSAMAPPVKKHKSTETPEGKLTPEAGTELDKLMLQVFLDREQFSAGPIVGDPGPLFTKVLLLYQSTHEDAKDDASLGAKAQAAVANVFTQYKLKAEDFRFIAPPKAETVEAKPTPLSARPRSGKSTARPHAVVKKVPLTYQELISMPMLAYRTPWEFVSERFHCQESYLRNLNEKLPATPTIGTEFRVPNVVPFEIEKAFEAPIQPEADPKQPVTAAVIGLSQLNIYQGGALVAVLPRVSCATGSARPQLLADSGRDPTPSTRHLPKSADRTAPKGRFACTDHQSGAHTALRRDRVGQKRIPRRGSQESGRNLLDQPGKIEHHRTPAVWSDRNKHSRPDEF